MIYDKSGINYSDDPKLIEFHNSRNNPMLVKCIKDNPPMYGFGKKLKIGDIVEINGTVHNSIGFCVGVPEENAFYQYDYFEAVNK